MRIITKTQIKLTTLLTLMLAGVLLVASAYAGGDDRRKRLSGLYKGVVVNTHEPITLSFHIDGNITLIAALGTHDRQSTFLGRWKGQGRNDSNLKYNNVNIKLTSFRHDKFICGSTSNNICEFALRGNLLSRENGRLTGFLRVTAINPETRESFSLDPLTINLKKQ